MYTDSLYSEKESIIATIDYCLGASRSHGRDVEFCFDFPLVDILYQIYKYALYDEDGRNDNLVRFLEEYRKEHSAFMYSVDELIELGWIETCFGHMHAIGHSHRICDASFRSALESCDDRDIIEFLIWMDEQGYPNGHFCISCTVVNELLDRWSFLYNISRAGG